LIDNTEQYPDVVEYLLQAKRSSVLSFIIDSEIVAVAPSDSARDGFRLLPFQDLSTRRGNKQQDDCVQIRVYAFDLLYLNGQSLLQRPLWERQALLRENFVPSDGFGFAMSVALNRFDSTILQNALETSVREGAEGLMVKLTGKEDNCGVKATGYESGKRSRLWRKLKKDYLKGADTIDVVPIGAWYGSGRKGKSGFLSPVQFAVYDEEEDAFLSVSRCLSFSDAMYEAMREFYFHGTPYPPGVGVNEDASDAAASSDQNIEEEEVFIEENADVENNGENRVNCFPGRPPSTRIITNENPPIWFKPKEVFEVSFADMTLSSTHTAGAEQLDQDGRGIALRFPRFKRRRPDKSIRQATTSAQIAEMFASQSKLQQE
jgi:DNA ligase-1